MMMHLQHMQHLQHYVGMMWGLLTGWEGVGDCLNTEPEQSQKITQLKNNTIK